MKFLSVYPTNSAEYCGELIVARCLTQTYGMILFSGWIGIFSAYYTVNLLLFEQLRVPPI